MRNVGIFGVLASSIMLSFGGMLLLAQYGSSDMRHRRVGMSLQILIMTSPLYDMSYHVPQRNNLQPDYNIIDSEIRLFVISDAQRSLWTGSDILLRKSWSVSYVFIFVPFGCMMIFFSSQMSAVFAGARLSSKVTLDDEYISAVVFILLGLVQPGFNIKLFTKLLLYTFIFFPAGAPHQFLGTHRSFQLAPHLVSPCFDVV